MLCCILSLQELFQQPITAKFVHVPVMVAVLYSIMASMQQVFMHITFIIFLEFLCYIGSSIHYDDDWDELDYLVVTRETGFEVAFLDKFDVEILIGQVRISFVKRVG